ncbi:MAG TPA: sugar phosphate nucleotidyltransferase [Patescibacteria group bacterium]|nr:sugar phosphate nucleotidyltransferase [Patescibacteria group bacterium]
MKQKNHLYAVIMAGGSGTRLWPLSRKEKPKQFHKLTSGSKTMLQETFERVVKVVPKSNILVSTTAPYAALVREQLPTLSPNAIIIEPCARNTAPAMALVASEIHRKDSDALIMTTPSDHAIKNPDEFGSAVRAAFAVLADHSTMFGMIGINPTFPSTELGYIKIGTELSGTYGKRVFSVDAFKEKPNDQMAKKYLASWQYLWNAAYFVFSARQFLALVKKHAPHIHAGLARLHKSASAQKREHAYALLPDEPVDTALTEKLSPRERFVVPSEMQWSDVGNWRTLYEFFKDQHGSSVVVKGNHIDVDSKNCFVYGGDKLIATIGLEDIVVIANDDAILVARKGDVHNVKKIIDKLKDQGKHLYL